jgi:molybdopterin adenylyltransferase
MSYQVHKQLSKDTPVTCAVLTVSDTRTRETDQSGSLITEKLSEAGHTVSSYRIITDAPVDIRQTVMGLAGRVEAIILNGGTGISKRDSTVDVLDHLLEKTLPGFGELFRMLSYEQIGPGAMLSRAIGGVYQRTLIFSIPGSPNDVTLAMDKLIVPELNHLAWELVRQEE